MPRFRLAIRLHAINTFDHRSQGYIYGDELIARGWQKFLERREDIASVTLCGPTDPLPSDKVDATIHFNINLPLSDTGANILYLQNAFSRNQHTGGTAGVFHEVMDRYDGYLFTSSELMKACAPGAVIPFSTDPESFYPAASTKYKLPISFVGNCNRPFKVNHCYLAPVIPLGLVIYGQGWDATPFESCWRGKLPMPDLPALYTESSINLNLLIPEHREMNLINMRIYDILACGGFIISDHVAALEAAFGDAVVYTEGHEDLWAKAVYFLADPAERKRRSLLGQRLVLAHHTHANRMETLMRYLKELL